MLCLVTQSGLTLCHPMDCSPPDSPVCGDSPGKNTGVGCHALLRKIFPTQGSNPSLPYCRWILCHLSHQGSPRILKWVAYPFSRGSSWPNNLTGVSFTAGGFFTSWATGEAHFKVSTLCYIFYHRISIFWIPSFILDIKRKIRNPFFFPSQKSDSSSVFSCSVMSNSATLPYGL